MGRNSMAVHLNRSYCEGFWEVLYIKCSVWRWRHYVVEWPWRDGDVRSECEEDEGSDCEGGDIDTDWLR
jgi:hypothetical protein